MKVNALIKKKSGLKSSLLRGVFIYLLVLTFSGVLVYLISQTFASSVVITITSPYKNYDYNYKGNLHTHSTNSFDVDSSGSSPAQIAQWYKDHGFGFFVISDHDKISNIGSIPAGIAWLGSSEEKTIGAKSASDHAGTSHMGLVNIPSNPTGSASKIISTVKNAGGLTILNHPGVRDPMADRSIISTSGLTGMEVFNALHMPKTLDYARVFWDPALMSGKKIWGFASDDAHKNSERGKGFNVVNSASPTPDSADTLANIKAGDFYASSPVDPAANNYSPYDLKVEVVGSSIMVTTTNGSYVHWIENGVSKRTDQAKSSSLTPSYVTGKVNYVRVEILNSKKVAVAWSQPIYITADTSTPSVTRPTALPAVATDKKAVPKRSYPGPNQTIAVDSGQTTKNVQFKALYQGSEKSNVQLQVAYSARGNSVSGAWITFGTTSGIIGPNGVAMVPNNRMLSGDYANWMDASGRNCAMGFGSNPPKNLKNCSSVVSNGVKSGKPAWENTNVYFPLVTLSKGDYVWSVRTFDANTGQYSNWLKANSAGYFSSNRIFTNEKDSKK
jgi:hypothetical protein